MENEIAKTDNNSAVIADEQSIKDKIYTIRGQQVMLDFDLAEIYGYSTRALNQQVKRNAERFPANFMFQLKREETDWLSRSHFVTSIQLPGVKGGRAYLLIPLQSKAPLCWHLCSIRQEP